MLCSAPRGRYSRGDLPMAVLRHREITAGGRPGPSAASPKASPRGEIIASSAISFPDSCLDPQAKPTGRAAGSMGQEGLAGVGLNLISDLQGGGGRSALPPAGREAPGWAEAFGEIQFLGAGPDQRDQAAGISLSARSTTGPKRDPHTDQGPGWQEPCFTSEEKQQPLSERVSVYECL